jgi:uncharacterized protein YqjF (DUF2071 family)
MNAERVFLMAEWRWLAMLHWPAPETLLQRYLPDGLELDLWRGLPYVSIVGFLFRDTRLRGWCIPCHREFPELNLRFYVRPIGKPAERGVCFVREVVPLPAVTCVANGVYNESYITCRMRNRVDLTNDAIHVGSRAEYAWKHCGKWNRLALRACDAPSAPAADSPEEYFTENYWGFTRRRGGGTTRYRVEHPPWLIWPADKTEWHCDAAAMYGPEWSEILGAQPEYAHFVEGSAVKVYEGQPLDRATVPRLGTQSIV